MSQESRTQVIQRWGQVRQDSKERRPGKLPIESIGTSKGSMDPILWKEAHYSSMNHPSDVSHLWSPWMTTYTISRER